VFRAFFRDAFRFLFEAIEDRLLMTWLSGLYDVKWMGVDSMGKIVRLAA
jgi:hypothetical protein